jgi:hypothetical protein
MLSSFWDMEDAILVHFTPKCETVNSQNYYDALLRKISPRSKKWSDAKLVEDPVKKPFSDGIEEIVKGWNRCVEVEGNYIEK